MANDVIKIYNISGIDIKNSTLTSSSKVRVLYTNVDTRVRFNRSYIMINELSLLSTYLRELDIKVTDIPFMDESFINRLRTILPEIVNNSRTISQVKEEISNELGQYKDILEGIFTLSERMDTVSDALEYIGEATVVDRKYLYNVTYAITQSIKIQKNYNALVSNTTFEEQFGSAFTAKRSDEKFFNVIDRFMNAKNLYTISDLYFSVRKKIIEYVKNITDNDIVDDEFTRQKTRLEKLESVYILTKRYLSDTGLDMEIGSEIDTIFNSIVEEIDIALKDITAKRAEENRMAILRSEKEKEQAEMEMELAKRRSMMPSEYEKYVQNPTLSTLYRLVKIVPTLEIEIVEMMGELIADETEVTLINHAIYSYFLEVINEHGTNCVPKLAVFCSHIGEYDHNLMLATIAQTKANNTVYG